MTAPQDSGDAGRVCFSGPVPRTREKANYEMEFIYVPRRREFRIVLSVLSDIGDSEEYQVALDDEYVRALADTMLSILNNVKPKENT